MVKRLWQRLTSAKKKGSFKADLAARYEHFQRLLAANNNALTLMTDMEEKLSGDYLFDFQYIRSKVTQLGEETGVLVDALIGLGGPRYQALAQALDRILEGLERVVNRRREIPQAPLVIPFEDLDMGMTDVVGGKNANLGEVYNKVGLPVPPGFAISTHAYKVFLDHNRLTHRIMELLGQWSLDNLDSLAQVSDQLKAIINEAQVPPELAEAMDAGYERLARQLGQRPLLAMRSSAVGEDLTLTFAGQYASYLNVRAQDMASRYKDIVASLFTPRALFYYKNKGFKEEEMAMGVVVMPIIAARASGVMFTRRPEAPEQEAVLINAVWGLGKYAVGGVINPDLYLAAYDPPGRILEQTIPPKPVMLVCLPEEGVEEVQVPPELVDAPCLTGEQIARMTQWAARLEAHYGKPQDVEWALDEAGRLWLLQSRLLQVQGRKTAERTAPRTLKDQQVLLDQGTVAYRGVGAGPVVLVRRDADLKDFPAGGVLVVRNTSPKFVTVMSQAAAIIADAGSPTGHMALLAREFKVPTILNTGNATKILQPGQEVTVDANYNNVYAGIIPELLENQDQNDNELADSPVFQTLREAVKKIVPLNLINPQDPVAFSPENCQTLHDVVRYAHEFSMREMFRLSERETDAAGEVVDLESDLPFKVWVLDLGGGLNPGWRRRVRPEQISSIPFKAFWEGLTAMRWPDTKPAHVKSLSSVFVKDEQQIAEGESPWRDQSYVILSRNYMNFSIRLGYHLSTVEAYVSDKVNDNYLTFGFRGGGSTPERRERRARLIEEIIDHLDLVHQRKGDLIEARLGKYPPAKMNQSLYLLGKLTLYTKQLDMVLFSDGIVDWYIKDFVNEHILTKS
jgi:pyruvate,water dikinase